MLRIYSIIPGLILCSSITMSGCSKPVAAPPANDSKVSVPNAPKPQPVLGTPDASGLQVEITGPTSKGLLRGFIRNTGTRAVRYNPCFLGNWEAVTVQARKGSNAPWVRVPRRKLKMRGAESVGPTAYKPLVVLPGKVMFRTAKQIKESQKNPSDFYGSSFVVPLDDFEWPQALKSGDIQLKIDQYLIKSGEDPKNTWAGTLSSGVITLDLKELNVQNK